MQGLQGLPGPKGDQGLQGIQGIQGLQGDQGIQGLPGTAGTNGSNGTSVTSAALSVGDTNCPNGGSSFTAGSTTTYACNGAKGDQGLQGIQGVQGPPGPSTGPAGGDLTGSYPNPLIAAGAVTNADLANPALTINPGTGLTGGGSVALGGQGTLGVADGGIGTTQLQDGAVTTSKFDPSAEAPNAAELGGTGPSGFIQGTGQIESNHVQVSRPATGNTVSVTLTIGGMSVSGGCDAATGNVRFIFTWNGSPSTTLWVDDRNTGLSSFNTVFMTGPNAVTQTILATAHHVTAQWVENSQLVTLTLTGGGANSVNGENCLYNAQAVIGTY